MTFLKINKIIYKYILKCKYSENIRIFKKIRNANIYNNYYMQYNYIKIIEVIVYEGNKKRFLLKSNDKKRW